MKKLIVVSASLIAILSFKNIPATFTDIIKWPNITPPVADINPHKRIMHADTVVDNYYWMIDYFKKGPDSSKVVQYLKAENEYLDTMMSAPKRDRILGVFLI